MVRANSFKDPLDESDYLELTKGILQTLKLSKEDEQTSELAAELKALIHKQLQSRKDSRMNRLSPNQLNSLQGKCYEINDDVIGPYCSFSATRVDGSAQFRQSQLETTANIAAATEGQSSDAQTRVELRGHGDTEHR